MAKKKVCVSFDFEHDRSYYNLLEAWNKNPHFEFNFSDCTPSEIQTESISTIKRVLSRKIGDANYMIAIIGKHSNDPHPNSNEIGYRNWQAYEIAKNHEKRNGLVVVKLDDRFNAPGEAYNIGAEWTKSFNQESIVAALIRLKK